MNTQLDLFKAINLDLSKYQSLFPFFKKISFVENKINVVFATKIKTVNKESLKVEEIEINESEIEILNKNKGFLGGAFVDDMYIASFDSQYIPALKELEKYKTGEGLYSEPVLQRTLEDHKEKIAVVEAQIEQAKQQIVAWEKDLEDNKKTAYKNMKSQNKEYKLILKKVEAITAN